MLKESAPGILAYYAESYWAIFSPPGEKGLKFAKLFFISFNLVLCSCREIDFVMK